MTELPEFILHNIDKSKWISTMFAKPFGMIWFGRKLSTYADIYKLNLGQLYMYTSRKVGYAKLAKAREGNSLGRLYNRMLGDRSEYIEISSYHLRQVYQVIEQEVPQGIVVRGNYLLRVDVADAARLKLKEIIENG